MLSKIRPKLPEMLLKYQNVNVFRFRCLRRADQHCRIIQSYSLLAANSIRKDNRTFGRVPSLLVLWKGCKTTGRNALQTGPRGRRPILLVYLDGERVL